MPTTPASSPTNHDSIGLPQRHPLKKKMESMVGDRGVGEISKAYRLVWHQLAKARELTSYRSAGPIPRKHLPVQGTQGEPRERCAVE